MTFISATSLSSLLTVLPPSPGGSIATLSAKLLAVRRLVLFRFSLPVRPASDSESSWLNELISKSSSDASVSVRSSTFVASIPALLALTSCVVSEDGSKVAASPRLCISPGDVGRFWESSSALPVVPPGVSLAKWACPWRSSMSDNSEVVCSGIGPSA